MRRLRLDLLILPEEEIAIESKEGDQMQQRAVVCHAATCFNKLISLFLQAVIICSRLDISVGSGFRL